MTADPLTVADPVRHPVPFCTATWTVRDPHELGTVSETPL